MNSRSRELLQAPAHCATTRREEGRGRREGQRTPHTKEKKCTSRGGSRKRSSSSSRAAAAECPQQDSKIRRRMQKGHARSAHTSEAAADPRERGHLACACKLLQSCQAVSHNTKACSPVHSREASSNLPFPPRPPNHTRTTAFCGRHTRRLRKEPLERK
jgi:hypothetical protein